MKLVDAHTHLSSEDFDADRAEVLARARQECRALIDIGSGTSADAHFRSQQLAEKEADIFFTAGVHPHDAETIGIQSKIRNEIEGLLSHPKCLAVGECGLDYFYQHSKRETQIECFNWQIGLAEKTKLPLMIHTRQAEADTMECLKNYGGPAVFHCFTSSQELANFGVNKGFFVSFSGIVTFKKAEDLRQVFLNTPLDNILIETDAPYLAPIPMRGKRNESSFLIHTAEFLAKLRGMDTLSFVEKTTENSLRCFSKLSV